MKIGQRKMAHPGTDAWMSGDRYGVIVKVGRALVHMQMDRSGRVRKFRPENLVPIDDALS